MLKKIICALVILLILILLIVPRPSLLVGCPPRPPEETYPRLSPKETVEGYLKALQTGGNRKPYIKPYIKPRSFLESQTELYKKGKLISRWEIRNVHKQTDNWGFQTLTTYWVYALVFFEDQQTADTYAFFLPQAYGAPWVSVAITKIEKRYVPLENEEFYGPRINKEFFNNR